MLAAETRRIIVAGAIGNVLEWYDFSVYGYFAASIGRVFFPHEDPVAQILSAFGIFAVGFFMRPVGGALIGYIGDRLGRGAALTFSVVAMAVPTFLVGVLPGHAVLGVMAPVLLTLLRMIQGLSVGGEYTTSIVFVVEHAPPGRRGLIGAMACCGAVGGILLGSATGAFLNTILSPEAMAAWGWRVPFVAGLAVGLAGFFVRRHLHEIAPARKAGAHSPLIDAVREHWRLLGRLAGLSVFNAVGFYLVFVYIVSWVQLADGIAPQKALEINTISMAMLAPVMIGAGWLSDRYGRKPFLIAGTVLGFVAAIPLLWLMRHPHPAAIQAGQLGFVLAVGLFLGSQPTAMVESTPARVRCTAVALGYNLTLGIVGGLTPMVATWLVHRTENELSPAYMVMVAATVSFLAALLFREGNKSSLDEAPLQA
ncbi:MAG TPA: MFS transporter [Reyranella sp.]|nr:MFS transporter [Reyranella sp.]